MRINGVEINNEDNISLSFFNLDLLMTHTVKQFGVSHQPTIR